jgi:predicted RNA binding protein YcfA (HicA-like mRNA interferase family)
VSPGSDQIAHPRFAFQRAEPPPEALMSRSETTKFLRGLPEGWQATRTARGHIRLRHPRAARAVIAPGTPGDWRSVRNALAEMRRALRDGGAPG